MPTPTYTEIASQALTGTASSIVFSGIPATYTDLLVKLSARNNSTATQFYVQLNSTTVSTVVRLWGDGNAVAANSYNAHYIVPSNYTASIFSNSHIYLPNYTTAYYKSLSIFSVGENDATQAYMNYASCTFSDTSAITSIGIFSDGASFVQYTTAYLYGIKSS